MAKCLHMNTTSYIYILILVLLISGKLLASATLLEDVCRQTHDQPLCMNILGSDPRTRDADILKLAGITIDLGSNSATGSEVKIHSLVLSEKDPQLRSRFVMCDSYYKHAINALREAVGHMQRKEYDDVNVQGTVVYGDAYECEKAFKTPPAYKSPITYENYHLEMFGEIIAVIAKLLA